MRRIRTDNVLPSVPTGGHIEVFQARKNASKDAAPQGLAISTLISAVQGGFDTFAELDALVSDKSLVNTEMVDTFAELDALVADETLLAASSIDSLAKLNAIVGDATFSNQALRLAYGGGITDGSGTLVYSSIEHVGDMKKTTLFIDLTGLKASATDLDIIGVEGADVVVNGAFAADTDWTKGADWSIAAGVATAAPGTGTVLEPEVALTVEAGATYEVTFTMSGYVAGALVGSIGGTNLTSRGSDATFTERVVAADTTNLKFTSDAASDYDIDDVSVKKVSGAFVGPFNASEVGSIFRGIITNLETPAGAVTDIDVYAADEATGLYDNAVADLTETALLTKGGAWSADINAKANLVAFPTDGQYLYFTAGAGAGGGTYTGGQFLLEFWGG